MKKTIEKFGIFLLNISNVTLIRDRIVDNSYSFSHTY